MLEERADTGCKATARGESSCSALRGNQAIGRGAFFGICERARSLQLYFRARGANRLLAFAPSPTGTFCLAAAGSFRSAAVKGFIWADRNLCPAPLPPGGEARGFIPAPAPAPGVTLPRAHSGSTSRLRAVIAAHEAACETVSVDTIIVKYE